MAKFLHLWELDTVHLPRKPDELALQLARLLEMAKKDLRDGVFTDWGQYLGGEGGYALGEGTQIEAFEKTRKYIPYLKFTTRPVLSNQEVIDAMMRSIVGPS